jgi:hypothetical protein
MGDRSFAAGHDVVHDDPPEGDDEDGGEDRPRERPAEEEAGGRRRHEKGYATGASSARWGAHLARASALPYTW